MREKQAKLIVAFPVLAVLSFAGISNAQTISAASCSLTDVQNALNTASRGAIVTVPAGSCKWNSTLTLTKGVTLTGAGVGLTVITLGTPSVIVSVSPDSTAIANSENITITGFTFDGDGGGDRLIYIHGSASNGTKAYRNFIFHDNTIQNTGSASGNGNTCIGTDGQVRGVIYHNNLDRCDMAFRPMGNDDIPDWENSAYNNFSPGSSDNLYFEDNTIEFSSSYTSSDGYGGWIESGQGGRAVIRFNTWNLANLTNPSELWDIHGFQYWNGTPASGESGTMIVEYYGNTVTNVGQGLYRWINHRGSIGMFINNTLSTAGGIPDVHMSSYSGVCPVNPNNLDGSGAYTGPNGVVNHTYVINNLANGTLDPAVKNPNGDSNYYTCGIAENSSWWTQKTSFNGTVGAGYGALASRPSTCTAGVGYWATDQGSWNQASDNSFQGYGKGNGALYQCTSTDTWTLYYVPYSYPHPLRNGVLPPTNLNAVVQ